MKTIFCPACHSVCLNGAGHRKASIYFQRSLWQIIDVQVVTLYRSNAREMMAVVTHPFHTGIISCTLVSCCSVKRLAVAFGTHRWHLQTIKCRRMSLLKDSLQQYIGKAEMCRHLPNFMSVYDLSFGFISNTAVQLHVNYYGWPVHLLLSLLDPEHNQ